MKTLNANRDGKFLAFNGWRFQFYCFQLKDPVGMVKISVVFSVGIKVQRSFPMVIKFEGIFVTVGDFAADFSVGRGSHWVCDTGR